MQKTVLGIMAALMLLALAVPAIPAGMPPADPAALWTFITKTDPYTKWGHWQDYNGMQKSRSPHGDQTRFTSTLPPWPPRSRPCPTGPFRSRKALTPLASF